MEYLIEAVSRCVNEIVVGAKAQGQDPNEALKAAAERLNLVAQLCSFDTYK